ncbi:MAG TPA: DUF29 domain-containing protein [Thermodesulfovibrionia bacterium]|nr:DUF29 domain-containing protein [Thermodesulfovibrionia bacterium]
MNKTVSTILYEKDFYAWTLHNAELLRQGKIRDIDAINIAEELESIGKSDRRQVINRLIVLLVHLLKWEYQKESRSGSWKGSIVEQRRRVIRLLEDSPSLNIELDKKLDYAYTEALKQASIETGLDRSLFPIRCPYSKEQILNDEFYP